MTTVEQQAKKATEAELDKAIDGVIVQSGQVHPKYHKEMKEMFKEMIQKDDQVQEQVVKAYEEFQNIYAEINEGLNKLMAENKLKEVLNNLSVLINNAKETGNKKAVIQLEHLYTQLSDSITLYILKNNISKVKNKSKIVSGSANWEKEFIKMRTKLGTNTKYRFLDPNLIKDSLNAYLSTEDVAIFFYSLSRFVNSNGQKGIDNNSIFISHLFTNLKNLEKESFAEYKVSFLDSVRAYIAVIKG